MPVARGLAAAALLSAAGCDDRPVPTGPDVVVITVDTLRADRLGFAGHAAARTPRMDTLAAAGRVYRHATAPLPRTTPALASLLSGRDPAGHGSLEVGTPMTAGVPTLATRLHAAGWETVAVSGSPVAGPEVALDPGFERFEVLDDPRAAALTERALALAARADEDRPLLLWVHYTDPHFPYLPEGGPEAASCRTLGRAAKRGKVRRWRIFGDTDGVASEALPDCQRLYDAEIAHVDAAIGALLDGLGPRAEGWRVLTADHGENMGEGGLWYEHGPDAHEASLRVPLVLAGPGVAPGTDDDVARLEDVAPTLLSGLGLPALDGAVGVDLLGALRPEAAAAQSGSALHARLAATLRSGRADARHCLHGPRYSLCSNGFFDRQADVAMKTDLTGTRPDDEARLAAGAARWPPEQARQHVVRAPPWKLVATPRLEGGYAEAFVQVSATDLVERPGSPPDATRDALRAALPEAVRAGLATGADTAPRDAESAARLRALGYVE